MCDVSDLEVLWCDLCENSWDVYLAKLALHRTKTKRASYEIKSLGVIRTFPAANYTGSIKTKLWLRAPFLHDLFWKFWAGDKS